MSLCILIYRKLFLAYLSPFGFLLARKLLKKKLFVGKNLTRWRA